MEKNQGPRTLNGISGQITASQENKELIREKGL